MRYNLALSKGSTDGQCARLIAVDKKAPRCCSSTRHLRDRGGARRLRQTVHELAGDAGHQPRLCADLWRGIHGRQSQSAALALRVRPRKRALLTTIDLRPYIAPHTLKLAPDGLIYITCGTARRSWRSTPRPNKVVDAIDSGSTNGHRLIISPRREAPLHRERGRRHRFGDRPAQAKTARKNQDLPPARRIAISARPHRGGVDDARAGAVPD